MVELAIGPLNRVVTQFAGCREAGVRDRTVRILEIRLVTSNAKRAVQVVVVVDVAVGAGPWGDSVRAG